MIQLLGSCLTLHNHVAFIIDYLLTMRKLKQDNTKKFNILNINEVCVVEILKIEFCKPVYCIKLQDCLVHAAVALIAEHYSRRTTKKK